MSNAKKEEGDIKETNVDLLRSELSILRNAQSNPHWNKEKDMDFIETKCAYTKNNFPIIWNTALKNEPGTYSQLELMISLIENIQTGKLDQEETTKKVGYVVFDKYAKPCLNPQQLRDYERSLRK